MRCVLIATAVGDPAPLNELLAQVSGPGCVIWPDVDPRASIEETIGLLLRSGSKGGARTIKEAARVASSVAARIAERIEAGQRRAEIDPHGCPFDLQAVVPVPRDVLLSGYSGQGRRWMRDKWGVDHPLAFVQCRVDTSIAMKPRGRGRPRAGTSSESWTVTKAYFEFEADAFPFPVFRRLLGQHPFVEFEVSFTDEVGDFRKSWRSLRADEVAVKDGIARSA